ncbi:MAG: hypothetical protein CSA66_06900 [Proteobacteria bacterium]|nr:MAG: hypothetical protein CSA66_06900 [Pseudomonadota bacterium]
MLLGVVAGCESDPVGAPTHEVPKLIVECAAVDVEPGAAPVAGDCATSQQLPGGGVMALVRANCTDPNITMMGDKPHLIMLPETVTRDVLWLHLVGTSGTPTNAKNLGQAAISQGYRYIALAYTNEPSVGTRCRCLEGLRDPTCEGLVRGEVIYGRDFTPTFNMEPDEAILPRLTALLTWLQAQQPQRGWGAFLAQDGAPRWAKIAVSGFSQGGGMAAMIARDHAVDRAVYFSVASGATPEAALDPSVYRACTDASQCLNETSACCPAADLQCEVTPAGGGLCVDPVPAEWTHYGRDIDGDGRGDGGVEDRATAASRQFAFVHRDEDAWRYAPIAFDAWGMGAREDFIDADSVGAPFDADARLFSTGLTPPTGCSEHQAMGSDACQPRRADGRPALWDPWIHAMTADVGP